jgi:hypothetical protein
MPYGMTSDNFLHIIRKEVKLGWSNSGLKKEVTNSDGSSILQGYY